MLALLATKRVEQSVLWFCWPMVLFAIVLLELSILYVAKLPNTCIPGMFMSAVVVLYTAPGQFNP